MTEKITLSGEQKTDLEITLIKEIENCRKADEIEKNKKEYWDYWGKKADSLQSIIDTGIIMDIIIEYYPKVNNG